MFTFAEALNTAVRLAAFIAAMNLLSPSIGRSTTILCSSVFSTSVGSIQILQSLKQQSFEVKDIDAVIHSRFTARKIQREDFSVFPWQQTEKTENMKELYHYIEGGAALRNEFNKKSKKALDKVETVIYPLAGTDSLFPALLFPQAKWFIALDNHPFASKDRIDFKFSFSKDSISYRDYVSIDRDRSRADRILSNLALSIPNFRLKSVSLLKPPGQSWGSALIVFDQGAGTSEQNFLYVKSRLHTELRDDWWMQFVSSAPIAVLAKGAMFLNFGRFWQSVVDRFEPQMALLIGSAEEIPSNKSLEVSKTYSVEKIGIGYGSRAGDPTRTIMHQYLENQ